ncbi:MAG: hypoxanthine phosphoribosyltransferase [Parcubacteria group bacterium]|nr:hypoxanthine phosphoribosyltransferase [Parcubacteria group bacterium]
MIPTVTLAGRRKAYKRIRLPKMGMTTWGLLIPRRRIATRIRELAREIYRDYRKILSNHEPLYLIAVLKGAMPFEYLLSAELHRLGLNIVFEYMGTSSYNNDTESTGQVRLTLDLTRAIANDHLLLVEDIVDTRLTLAYLLQLLGNRKPASLRVAALLDKPARARKKVSIHYTGFIIPNVFVAGMGLDCEQWLREVPDVLYLLSHKTAA